jgi:hypothetical protein
MTTPWRFASDLRRPPSPNGCCDHPSRLSSYALFLDESGAIEPLGPLVERFDESPEPLTCILVGEVAVLVEALVGVRDHHLGLGHHVGGAVQKDLPQNHLPTGRASAGLGREVTYALRLPTLPGYGEATVTWGKTPLGAFQRAWSRVPLLFGRPERVPVEWVTEQTKIAQLPGFTEATMAALRAQVDMGGQREVLVDQLPHLGMPTLIIWGKRDRVFPYAQGQKAASCLRQCALELIPNCGHLPHVEQPERFAAIVARFLGRQVDQ